VRTHRYDRAGGQVQLVEVHVGTAEVQPASVGRAARREPLLDDGGEIAAVGRDPADIEAARTASHEQNPIACRRPLRHAHGDGGVALKGGGGRAAAVFRRQPQVAVAAAVGHVNEGAAVGTDRGHLNLAGLVCDADGVAHVIGGSAVDGETPDVG